MPVAVVGFNQPIELIAFVGDGGGDEGAAAVGGGVLAGVAIGVSVLVKIINGCG